ncbi:lytic transglycosylase domain-containing protein [Candidatus Gottesmanbacteria bacterium]|nr:lytic transglycosylase domain-containing protein [Candidatus Gottesmanbacteria bacterium]
MKKEFKKEVESSFSYSFETDREGLYTISVKASCKPGWRNKWWLWFKGKLEDILDLHLDDEDLRVEIDNIKFRKPKNRQGLFNSPAAFSGTKTLGKTKTVVFLIYLTKGSHTIKFIPDGSPYLESVEIKKLDNPQKFIAYLNTQAENENYYSWYTFALVDLPLKTLFIIAQAGVKEDEKDDDDLKILINGELQKNPQNRHKHSYFCGFTLKGRQETFSKTLNLPKATHYIELFADKTPVLKKVEIDFGTPSEQAQAKVVWDKTNLRRESNTTSDILAQLSQSDVVVVLEKAIKGERPKNKEGEPLFSDRWHRVYYKGMEGYIYSEALEIEGEDKETIKKLIIQKAEELSLDSSIALGLGWCESRFFPYAVSKDEAKGIFQLSPDLIADLNNKNKPFYSPVKDPFNIKESIAGGLSYFKWLCEKYKGDPQQFEKAIVAYNAGPGNVPQGRLDLSLYEIQTQKLVSCVKSYEG